MSEFKFHLLDRQEVEKLPALSIAGHVNNLLQENSRLIVTAAPGAGKSTLLPLTILEGIPQGGKIFMLEPRRLAARQIAERMADLLHEPVGKTVGYRVRFEKKVSTETRIEVLTEGILTRMLVEDPMLDGVSVLIFDEFHERSLASDVALALARESQQLVRPDLRIVLMSATIDASAISSALDAPVVESEGRMFPVDVIRSTEEATAENVVAMVARSVREAYSQQNGDILAFLPGQSEILRCKELLDSVLPDADIYPLYGLLSPQDQRRAIMPSPEGHRKVVLATSIAETSLTIEGVRVVVDSGLCRTLVFDQRNGLSRLETVRISLDMANQRAGRAGRLAPGVCFRLWSLATEHRMQECRRPEVLDADLAPMVLDVASFGESDVMALPWLTPPPVGNVAQASKLLKLLGATDYNGKITTLGRSMVALPCHPRIARMLVLGKSDSLKALSADIAALIEEKDPLSSELADADINTRLCLLREARTRRQEGKWSRIIRIAKEYCALAKVAVDNAIPSAEEVGMLIATAYPERVAVATDGCGRFRLSTGGTAFVDKDDMLSSANWLAVASLNAASGKVFLASPFNPKSAPHLSNERDNVSWDSKQGRVVAQHEKLIGGLVVDSKPLNGVDKQQVVDIVCAAAVKEGLSMLDFSDDVARLQRRVACVAIWHPELELPDLSTEAVLQRSADWLPFYLEGLSVALPSVADLKKIDLPSALMSLLSYEQQQEVERLAPSHIIVPTGSKIKVDYRQGAEAPVVSVRLQECFGLTDTPCVDGGKRPVLMELLSPGFKPVQLTQDLRSFWSGMYFEVRKELKRRYPKHSWSENPLEAEAIRGVKRNK